MRIRSCVAVVLAASVLGGVLSGVFSACSSPSASFYTLKPDAALKGDGAAVPLNVVVSPVTIPDLINRPQFVTRQAGNQVSVNEFERWAEPLKGEIARVVAADLAVLLGTRSVSVYELGAAVPPPWRVRVDVLRFDSAPGDAATLEALWTVWPPTQKAQAVQGHSLVHEPVQGAGYDALVAAHDRALAGLSRDIAAAIRTNLPQ